MSLETLAPVSDAPNVRLPIGGLTAAHPPEEPMALLHHAMEHPGMADQASALACASDADQFLVVEPGRAILRPYHRQENPAGVHQSVGSLKADISSFIDQHNVAPQPFRWTKSASDILVSVERFCVRNTPREMNMALMQTSGSGH